MKIEDAINQSKFNGATQKASINLLYTASWYSNELQHTLKPFGITWQQFNLMRILRGQEGCAVSLKDVSERMIDHMSNTSRLVDKLVAKGIVNRETAKCDRRQLVITLTREGSTLLDLTSDAVSHLGSTMFGHMDEEKLNTLNDILDELREKEI